ncbi:dipeptide/oligopeptide/nickel ABC transporter ATP-binding protein [Actinocatenispora thailandica]|uniref:Dipeptide/oligopeptide/nickel ABC transporter ATP-binding protein n=1 Tax=Actinocatenispora thailandica TaxID=227318 RepID=A0A7R7HXW4_9ACTN|nr:ABC transporter ATP-binding protein [Actinocatenispora thailandica]BCJ35539.1 dipeptide/oligopeptide/nickel ABC transporter ATP-binding protein [Actinocatenispora thailandica]
MSIEADPPAGAATPAADGTETPAATGAPLVVAEHLTRVFGRGSTAVRAVDDVSFELRRGEITTVVGESGSGKSTLARMLLKLLPVSSGRLVFDGADVTGRTDTTAYWRQVQAVFQDPFSAFNQFFTVRRLLARSRRLLGAELTEQRMLDALEQVGLPAGDVLGRYPHQLSGGQRQRVMIARALLMRPSLLIADEATSMLDASLRATILNVLTDLRDRAGLTILFITHDIGQACYVSDQVLVLSQGRLVEAGPAERVIFDPRHDYTRKLLADVPRLHDAG